MARTWLLSMILGFHNAWEQEDASLEELGIRIHASYRSFNSPELAHPERCFFFGQSSLCN